MVNLEEERERPSEESSNRELCARCFQQLRREMELRLLILPSEVVPAERRIKVVAQDVEQLREQVLTKLRLAAAVEAGLDVYVVPDAGAPVPVRSLAQLEDKSKLQVLRTTTPARGDAASDNDERRARLKSAFALISEGAEDSPRLSDVSVGADASTAEDGEGGEGGEGGEDGEDVPGTTFIRYYNADGVPYYYDRETGETQWDEPQAPTIHVPSTVAAEPVAGDPATAGAHTSSARASFGTGQAVSVKGHPEVWDVVRVDAERDLIQVQLRGESIKKTFSAHQLVASGDATVPPSASERGAEPQPQPGRHVPGPVEQLVTPAAAEPARPAVAATGTQKLRVFIADSADSGHPGEPAGFVMVASSASLVDVREEITEDELEVPESFSFVVDGDVVKRAQEKKVRMEHFIPHGHVRIVRDGEATAGPARQSAAGPASGESDAPEERGSVSAADGKLPVLVGHLSKCGQMPFSAWQNRYFRLSNGTLSYFAAPDDKVAKGSVVIDETCTVENAGEKYKKKFCFEVSSWKSQLALCAECEEDCELWKAHVSLTVKTVKVLAAERGIKRGLVDKRDSGFMKKWREKWAVLNRTTLSFYDTPDDPARQRPPSDEFELLGATVDVAASSAERHFCFTVIPSQHEPIELSTGQKDELEDWVRMLQSNIEGTTVSVPTERPSWGVQNAAAEWRGRGATSSGWFDVPGIKPEISVVTSRQRRIDGEKTSEYYMCISHSCASMSWHVSRKLQDILDLHDAISNTDPTKHEYLEKFIQLPKEKRSKTLNTTELEQHRKLVQVYAEEALKQAGPVDHSALRTFFCPTDKGFDQHRGCLTIQRRAHAPLSAQACWCELRTSDHTFSWSLDEHAKDGIRVSLIDSILVTQKNLLVNTAAAFELILPQRGIRILAASEDSYAATQWIECLKTEVSHVISETEGSSLLTGESMFAVEITPLEAIPWLGAQTPDHTSMRAGRLSLLTTDDAAGTSMRITDPRLLARLGRPDDGSSDGGSDSEAGEAGGDDEDDDVYDSEEDDADEFSEQPVGPNRRLSATMDTSDGFLRSANSWNNAVSPAVVLDTGSYAIKAGLACDSFPSVVERSYDLATGAPLVCRENVGGATAEAVITTDWDAVTSVWEDIFHQKMGIYPADHNFVLTEAPDMTRVSKQTMAEIMFEYFNAPAITIQCAGVLALYAQGIWTGVVLDCGNRTKITPVYEGTVIPHAVMQSCFGGADIDSSLTSMLVEKHGATYSRDTSKLDMQRFKEQHAFVGQESGFAAGMGMDTSTADLMVKHRMSTGTHLQFDRERFLCGEQLFTAGLPNGCKGLPQAVQWSIQKCESVLRKELFSSIVLCGGTTCIEGFQQRMQHDTAALLANRGGGYGNRDRAYSTSDVPKVKIIAPRNRKYTAWLGGANLAQMDGFEDRTNGPLVSADDYDERGPDAVVTPF